MLRALTTPRSRESSAVSLTDLGDGVGIDGQPSPSAPQLLPYPLDVLQSLWSHFVADLVDRREDVRERAATELRRSLSSSLSSLPFNDGGRVVDELTNRTFDLINSADSNDKLAGLTLLHQLISLHLEPLHDLLIQRCAHILRLLLPQLAVNTETRVIDLAARTLGHLCHTGGTLTTDVAHHHLKQALDWMQSPSLPGERNDRRHLAAVYVLRELSAQVPSVFAAYLQAFGECVWVGLRDVRPETREVSIAVVDHALTDAAKRSPAVFTGLCERLYEEARSIAHSQAVLFTPPLSAGSVSLSVPSSPLLRSRHVPRSPPPPVKVPSPASHKRSSPHTLPSLHAAFLVLTQLIVHNRPLMLQHFSHLADLTFRHREAKDPHIIRSLLVLLPLLCSLRQDLFLTHHAEWVLDFILTHSTLVQCVYGDVAMQALSQLISRVGEGLTVSLDGVVQAVLTVLNTAGGGGTAGAAGKDGGVNGGVLLTKKKEKEREGDRRRRLHRTTDAALECVGVLSKHLSISFYPYADQLLDAMLRCPLSPSLISSLSTIMQHVPALVGDIQERLADLLILLLSTPFMDLPTSNGTSTGLHGHGHSHSISSFSALASYSASASSGFFPLTSPTSGTHAQSPSPTPPSPINAPAPDLMKPTSPYALPRHLQLHRLSAAGPPSTPLDRSLVLLAFSTLQSFPFSFSTQFSLLCFTRFTMTLYLEDDNLTTRKEAALTTHQLVAKFADAISTSSTSSPNPSSSASTAPLIITHLSLVCYDITRKLVVLSVTDSSLSLRSSLMSAFIEDARLDRFLLQTDLLTTLSLALHDEYALIRESAILLLGRLSARNPAIILPILRRTLLQLLHELQAEELGNNEAEGGIRGGGEGRRGLSQEEGAKLLGQLIGSCHALIKPYVDSILGVLVPKLNVKGGGDGEPGRKRSDALVASVLSTLGKLSVICGEGMDPFLDHLMPLLLDSLYPSHVLRSLASTASATPTAPPASPEQRQMTLRTLTLLLSSTSPSTSPFLQYPHFLPCLLHLIKTDKSSATRMEAMRVIGVVGAIDPFEYRKCQAEWIRVVGEGEEGGLGGSLTTGEARVGKRGGGTHDSGKSASAAANSVRGDGGMSAKDGKVEGGGVKEEVKGVVDGDDGTGMVSPSVVEAPRPPKADGDRLADDDDSDGPTSLFLCQSQSYDEYFPSVAIASLMRVVLHPRLSSFHSVSLSALMFILKTLGREKCQPFLPSIVPVFLRELRTCDEVLKESYLAQLAQVVQLVGAGVKVWVEELTEVALTYWPLPAVVTGASAPPAPLFTVSTLGSISMGGAALSPYAPPPLLHPILRLFEAICLSMPSHFQSHLPLLVSRFLSLFADIPSEQNIASARAILSSLALFSAHSNLTSHLHLILPSLLDLTEETNNRQQPRALPLRIDAVHAIATIASHHDCSAQASRILQPFARILASTSTTASYSAAAGGQVGGLTTGQSSPVRGSGAGGTGVASSMLFVETLSAVCTLIPQMSFTFLLFEPLITKAIRDREKAERAAAMAAGGGINGSPGGSSHGGMPGGRGGRPEGDRERERQSSAKDKEALQTSRYLRLVEKLKERLDELREKERRDRDGAIMADEEEWTRERERDQHTTAQRLDSQQREKPGRRGHQKDRRSTFARLSSTVEREREKEREREHGRERDRKERLRQGERDQLSSYHLIAGASVLPMEDLDDYAASPSPAFTSPNTSPAQQPPQTGDGLDPPPPLSLSINQATLVKSFSSFHQFSSDDWYSWLRTLQLELLRESPSFALRACSALAAKHSAMARELMCPAFLSCWMDMDDVVKDQVIDALDHLLTICVLPSSPVPADAVLVVLAVTDYCEQHQQSLPLSHRTLGAAAERHNSFARALYHFECIFHYSPSTAIESLISINNKLQLNDAAAGVLLYAATYEKESIKERWYEKLHRWDEALSAYERRQLLQGEDADVLLGRMRCMKELQQWERLAALGSAAFLTSGEESTHALIAPLLSSAMHQLRYWGYLEPYLPYLSEHSYEGCFYRAVYAIHVGDYAQAQRFIDSACECVDGQLGGLVGESYSRAYGSIVRLQQCTELSEIISYKAASDARKAALRKTWSARLRYAQKSVGVWSEILSVRALVMTPTDDEDIYLEYAKLARKSGKLGLSLKVLTALVGFDPTVLVVQPPAPLPSTHPQLTLACLKHLYMVGYRRMAYNRLSELVNSDVLSSMEGSGEKGGEVDRFKARCYLKLGGWQMDLMDGLSVTNFYAYDVSHSLLSSPISLSAARRELEQNQSRNAAYNAILPHVLNFFHAATVADPTSFKAWHQLAMMNFSVVQRNKHMQHHYNSSSNSANTASSSAANSHRGSVDTTKRGSVISLIGAERRPGMSGGASVGSVGGKFVDINHHIVPAINAFFRSIWLQKFSDNSRQDVLRVLQLWFEYGYRREVELAMIQGINTISIDTWLAVIPQIIARLHTPYASIRALIHELLAKIGKQHPQALVYPLTVASKSHSDSRRASSLHVLATMRQHSAGLVQQASMVSTELVRVAILWHEMWNEAIEEASRHWFGHHNADAMLSTLAPLHQLMEKGPTTINEQQFAQLYGAELAQALSYCANYSQSQSTVHLTKAWEIYSDVFRRMGKTMQTGQPLQLPEVSPRLLHAQDLQLAVPGSYRAGAPVVRIAYFSPVLRVIESKQHPRRLSIAGSDGRDYAFLLKGHEDLRQDERVMQLFGLVNTFLSLDRSTAKSDLQISRYAVIPLSPNSGLLEWVPAADTLHAVIKQYRDAKQVQLNVEQRLMLKEAPDYQLLPLLHKVEVFEHALLNTSEFDLARALYIRAGSAEVWLDHRQRYTRSLAVMSMVGYILGLGDRHPCNLMLERRSGQVVHIDFGDCFDVAMTREKYPERVPFRLTRMLRAAMECGGLAGSYQSTCIVVMAMMRKNKNSAMALLEAFVYDPLWRPQLLCLNNWRLLEPKQTQPTITNAAGPTSDNAQPSSHRSPHSPVFPPAPAPNRRTSTHASRRPSALSLLPLPMPTDVDVGTNPVTRDRRRSIVAVAEEEEREKRLDEARRVEEDEELNEKAVAVIERIGRKLRGTDFEEDGGAEKEGKGGESGGEVGSGGGLDVQAQVERLIREATSHVNLAQAYVGWCAFW